MGRSLPEMDDWDAFFDESYLRGSGRGALAGR